MLKLLLLLLAGYAILVIYIYLTQYRMIYFPDVPGRSVDLTPADLGLDYEDVIIRAADGTRLNGWFVPGEGRGSLLFLHGNAGNISHRLDSIGLFHDFGLSVLIIDYRGYGRSEGRPSERGTYEDAEAAWRYMTEQRGLRADDIVIFGRSLGGPIAAWLASHHRPRGLIVESAFTSVPELGGELYWWFPAVRWASRFRYPTREFVRQVRCPVLVVHSRNDELIPFRHGESIFAAANEPRTLLELHGSHNDAHVRSEGVYREGLNAFFVSLRLPETEVFPDPAAMNSIRARPGSGRG
jgi:fermentation-respiration switch protein FrsA (DUF1100 family)